MGQMLSTAGHCMQDRLAEPLHPATNSQPTILGSSDFAADWEASAYFRLKVMLRLFEEYDVHSFTLGHKLSSESHGYVSLECDGLLLVEMCSPYRRPAQQKLSFS